MQVEVRLLRESDVPTALRLKELAHWNQTEADWLRLLRLEPRGCFCATIGGEVVATTTTTTYGRELAWIGMVLVDPEYRKRGIASKLMHTAIDYLSSSGVITIKLDATPTGRSVYENLGFEEESLIERWEGIAGNRPGMCTTLDSETRGAALALDRKAFGTERSNLIELLIDCAFGKPLVAIGHDQRVQGYGLVRRGTLADYVGPLVATEIEAATALLDGLLNQLTGQRVYLDLNTEFEGGRGFLTERGLAHQRDLIRMCYGQKNNKGLSSAVFAIAGPEVG